jgi:hypothetical protein
MKGVIHIAWFTRNDHTTDGGVLKPYVNKSFKISYGTVSFTAVKDRVSFRYL